MAEDARYSIISVTSDEEEDLVIQAGIPSDRVDGAASAEGEDAFAATEEAWHPDGDEVPEAEDEPAVPVAEPTAEERARQARAEELERLREAERELAAKPPQARMRLAVLAVCAVGVVIACVCYALFFGH